MKNIYIFLIVMQGITCAMESPSSSRGASQNASAQVSEYNSEAELPLIEVDLTFIKKNEEEIQTKSAKKKKQELQEFDTWCRTLMLLESKVVEGQSFTLTEPEVRQGIGNLNLSEREIGDLKFYLKGSIPLTQAQLAVYKLPRTKFLIQFPIAAINLANNNLRDLPDEFRELAHSLEVLHLDNNKFTMVPPILAWFNKLTELTLTKNQIPGKLPEWIRRIKKLAIDLDETSESVSGSNTTGGNVIIKSASGQSTNTQDLLTNSQGNASTASSQLKSEQGE